MIVFLRCRTTTRERFEGATRNGVVRLDPMRWLAGTRETDLRLTRTDGLRSTNFGMCRGQGSVVPPHGRLLFASLQGVVSVVPTSILMPAYGPTPINTRYRLPISWKESTSKGSRR